MKVDIKSKSELESLSLDIKEKELTIVIDYPKYRFEDVLIISNKANEIILKGIKLTIIIQADGRNFNDEELSIFMALEKELNKLSLPLYFDGGVKDTYSLEELIKADKILDEIIDKINKSNLSPLEKYLYIYKYLSSKPYKFDQREKDPDIREEYIHLPRDIISVTNTDYIVCQGYGELNKYLCKNVGIDVFINYLYVIDSEGAEAHLNNLVILKDDKYDVNGVFYSDACWDNGGDIRTFSFALVPLSDIHKINLHIRFISDTIIFIPYEMTIFGYVEGTQGLDICTVDMDTDDPNYEPQYQVTDIVNYLNIKDEVIDRMELAMQLFKKYKDEIDKVITLFKDNDIPADVYFSRFETPIGSSLQFFLAITLTHQNKKITNWSISRLKQELEKVDYEGYSNNPLGFYDYVHNMNVIDVYETLNEIKNLDPKEYDMSYLEFYKKVVTLQAKRSNIEYEREEYQTNYLHYELLLNIILLTVQLIQRMLINIYIQKEVYKTYNVKNRIEASKFKEALKNVYMFEGLSEIEANIKVNESLKATDKINKKAFRNNAESYAYLDDILK